MTDTNDYINGQQPILAIENELVFLNSLKEVENLSVSSPVKMEYNAFVLCRRGRFLLEMGGDQQVLVKAGQLLIVPAQKLLQPMMVSTDIEASALLLSDRVLHSVLGSQIDIWNRAMYMHKNYVVDTHRWSNALQDQSQGIFGDEKLVLFREIAMSFLRSFMLIICEELLRIDHEEKCHETSSTREMILFNQFLNQLKQEQQKRRKVTYYAEKLCITPKYLSTICHNVSGKSPLRWITESVMEESYAMLRNTDITIKEISNRMGFPNPSFFGQYFREHAGATPQEYRTRYKNQH